MPNKNYVKGRRKEYAIMADLRDNGFIATRAAGSHSPFDVIGVNKETQEIVFVQAKPDSMSEAAKQRLIDEHNELNTKKFTTSFIVI